MDMEASPNVVFIGIAGPSGAGKSTLAERLAAVLGSPLAPIPCDWYNGARVVHDTCGKRNYETLESHDLQLFKHDLLSIRKAFAVHGRCPEVVQVGIPKNRRNVLKEDATGVAALEASGFSTIPVVVEGFLLFHDAFISSFFDVRIWIEVDCEVGLRRRFERRQGGGRQDLRRRRDTIDVFSGFYRDMVWANYLKQREAQLTHVQDALRLDGAGFVVQLGATSSTRLIAERFCEQHQAALHARRKWLHRQSPACRSPARQRQLRQWQQLCRRHLRACCPRSWPHFQPQVSLPAQRPLLPLQLRRSLARWVGKKKQQKN